MFTVIKWKKDVHLSVCTEIQRGSRDIGFYRVIHFQSPIYIIFSLVYLNYNLVGKIRIGRIMFQMSFFFPPKVKTCEKKRCCFQDNFYFTWFHT